MPSIRPLALLCLLAPLLASAGDRHWLFTADCAGADWLGQPPPARPSATCWAQEAGSTPGQRPPRAGDDVFILAPAAQAVQMVQLLLPGRDTTALEARSLLLRGSSSFAAGLAVDRGRLDLVSLALGSDGQAGLGLLQQTGGEVVAGSLDVFAGRVTLGAGALVADSLRLARSSSAAEARLQQQGGSVTARLATVGATKAPAAAAWALSGAATRATVSERLVVGGAGPGTLGLHDGARLAATTGTVVVGEDLDASGHIDLQSGADLDAKSVVVGVRGAGRVTLGGAGTRFFAGGDTLVGGEREGDGQLLLSIEGQAAAHSLGRLVVGRAGQGRVEIRRQGPPPNSVANRATIAGWMLGEQSGASGVLVLDGVGLFDFPSVQARVVGDQGNGVLEVRNGGWIEGSRATLAVGRQAGGIGRATFSGGGMALSGFITLDIGRAGRGVLEFRDGAWFQNGDATLTLGAAPGGRGELRIGGRANGQVSQILVSGVDAAGQGSARLQLDDGGLLLASTVTLGRGAVLALQGGTLSTRALTMADPASLDWRSGTLQLNSTAALDGTQLPRALTLTAGRTLAGAAGLVLPAGSSLTVGAGGELRRARLRLDGDARLLAQGTLDAKLLGSAASTIEATGPLTLGLEVDGLFAPAFDGFVHRGVLRVGGHAVTLRDADAAELGVQTRLADGGVLRAANGLWLAPGGAIVSEGQARIDGALRNDGEVFVLNGELTLGGPASGEGSWSGNLRIASGFDPGAGRLDLDFAGGNLSIEHGALMRLDVLSAAPRDGADLLTGIGHLAFDGRLQLDFAPGFASETAVQLQLLGFASFSGRLDATNVQVQGLPAWRVDLSQLAGHGSITVSPVPEPAAAVLWGLGLAALWARGRRRG